MEKIMIYAAAFVAIKDNKILLTRTRDNTIWYQAGGKIEQGETPKQTIVRELKEELDLDLIADDVRYLGNITTDNHDRTTTVSLECFTAEINQKVKPCAEISAIKWFDFNDTEFVAPAVLEVISKYKSGEWII